MASSVKRSRYLALSGGVLVLCLLFLTSGAMAQEDIEQKGLDTVIPNISVSNIDIREVLILLSRFSNLNFTTTRDVKGTVTVELSNVTVRQVLDAVLKDNGLNYVVEGSIIRVMTQQEWDKINIGEDRTINKEYTARHVPVEDLQTAFRPLLSPNGKMTMVKQAKKVIVSDLPEVISRIDDLYPIIDSLLVTRVFRLEHVDVELLRQQLEALIEPRRGQIQVDKERNVIILTTTPDNLEKAAKIIAEFDYKLEIEVFQIQFADPQEVVKLLRPLLTKEGYVEIHEQTSRIIIRDIPSRIDVAREVIESIDVPPNAVWIEAEIVNVNMKRLRELGMKWELGKQVVEPTATVSDRQIRVTDSLFRLLNGELNYVDFATIGSQALSVSINALENRGVTNILASPRVLVLNDEEAQLQVGSEEPFLVRQRRTTSQIDDYDIYTQRSREVGIILRVTPHIIPAGYVKMDVVLEDSTPRRVVLGNQDALAVDQQKAESVLIVKDGRTVAMGGLIRRTRVNSRSGVPFLSTVPVLGLPFRNTSVQDDRQKLLLFITPHIVSVDDPYRRFQYDDSLKARMYERDGVTTWLDRTVTGDKDNQDAWYHMIPPDERVYQPGDERVREPILLPPGDYDESGIFWTPGRPLPPGESEDQSKGVKL